MREVLTLNVLATTIKCGARCSILQTFLETHHKHCDVVVQGLV